MSDGRRAAWRGNGARGGASDSPLVARVGDPRGGDLRFRTSSRVEVGRPAAPLGGQVPAAGSANEPAQTAAPAALMRHLGVIVSGSLNEGLEARLNPDVSVEEMAVGRYVVIEGRRRRFFGMVTDVRLGASSAELALAPPDLSDPFLAEALMGTATFGVLKLALTLTLERDDFEQIEGPKPVKTVPSHYSPLGDATQADIEAVFGREDATHYFIGTPLDMEVRVCVDLARLVARSTGVFGKSGTGKTFLTRLLLIGIAQKEVAVNLVFDMHNEYGWEGTAEGGRKVKGLKQLFRSKVAIFTLDEKSSRDRGVSPDFAVQIGYDQIEPEDIAMAKGALGMTDAQIESVHRLARQWGEDAWLARFIRTDATDREGIAQEFGLNPNTLNVLHRKMERLARLPFLRERAQQNSVKKILDYLQQGIHVVLEFGRHNSLDVYILVANILTRRIHEQYVEQTDRAMGSGGGRPRPLVITIEEAHKFLAPEVADLTIFGTIAREMRKYNVTLLVVDQRPSSIADEVMSQIGTRVTCLLDDEKDIAAVLSGVAGGAALRGVLAKLDTRRQALLLGHAVPMPVVIHTREYGTPESYAEFKFYEGAALSHQAQEAVEELFPE